jgi:hypothetical protein
VRQADDQEPFLPPEEETELLARLRAAFRPSELDPEVHEQLLAVALEDPFAPASEAELLESQRLRQALEEGSSHPDAEVLRALGAPFAALDEAALERALSAAERAPQSTRPPRRNVVYLVFGAGSAALAAAAAFALLFAGSPRSEPSSASSAVVAPKLVQARSTADLFDEHERFETSGTTARMDRIASARSRDLRDNRYAAWGVR